MNGGSTLINIYDDQIEFVLLGCFVLGLELRSVFLGVLVQVSQSGYFAVSDKVD